MTVPNCRPSWMASGSRAPQDAGDQGRAQTASSLTRATAMGGVVSCSAADTFPTLFPNDATSARDERLGQDDRSSSIPRSMRVAMSSSAASIGSNSGVGWLPATRNAPSITGR
jgi:hypothetical protein